MVRISEKDADGRRVVKILGYYATYAEAAADLAKYNDNPYDVDVKKITMAALYETWYDSIKEYKSENTLKGYRTAFRQCLPLHSFPYVKVTGDAIQRAVSSSKSGRHIRELFQHLDEYAKKTGIPIMGYAHGLLVKPTAKKREPVRFSDAETAALWRLCNPYAGEPDEDIQKEMALEAHPEYEETVYIAESILIMLYSGWRIDELLKLRSYDINQVERTMKGGNKTEAGKGRVMPIHSAIWPIIEKRCKGGAFIVGGDYQYTPRVFRNEFYKIMKAIGAKHTPHETRKTFRSWLKLAGVDEISADKLMGHKSNNVGADVYTLLDVDELRQELEKIKVKPRFDFEFEDEEHEKDRLRFEAAQKKKRVEFLDRIIKDEAEKRGVLKQAI